MTCVYEITCTVNGKRYIGKTVRSAQARFRDHLSAAPKGKTLFHKALAKYGKESFVLKVVADGLTEQQALSLEVGLIAEGNTKAPHGYNLTEGGEGVSGLKFSPESIERLRNSHLGYVPSNETRKRISEALRGRVRTQKHQARLADARRGQRHSQEARAKMSAALQGRELTPEHIEKVRAALIGRPVSEATREKLRLAHLGRARSPETLAKMRSANLGKQMSEQAKRRISEGLKAAYAAKPRPPVSEETRQKMRESRLRYFNTAKG